MAGPVVVVAVAWLVVVGTVNSWREVAFVKTEAGVLDPSLG